MNAPATLLFVSIAGLLGSLGCVEDPAIDGDDFESFAPAAAEEAAVRAEVSALSRGERDECHAVGGIVRAYGAPHLQDASLVQNVGAMVLVSLDPRNPIPGMRFARGALLNTVVGAEDDGTILFNHHFAFERGLVRTQNDRIRLSPTDDSCVLDVESELFVADGTGVFAGVTGDGQSSGTLNVCTGKARLIWAADFCL